MARLSRFAAFVVFAFLVLPSLGASHDAWVEVRSPNFVIVCNAGEKQARKSALQFEEIRVVFRQSFKFAGEHPSPVITVLAVKDEDSMRELMPEYWTKGHTHPGGLFANHMDLFFAAVNLEAHGDNAYETFYHEYYHSLTMPYFPNLPLWLAEGLAEFYGHTVIDDKFVGMGQADAMLLAELKSESAIPLALLFKTDQSSPYYNEANKTSIFYAESWALTHYLMIGDRGVHRAMLSAYLNALDRGKTQDEAAAAAFGDLKKLQAALQSYIDNRTFYYMKSPAPAKISDSELQTRPLSEAEAEAYRGGFAAMRNQPQQATEILEGALRLDPKVALAYEYLGVVEYSEGQHEKALESMSKAVALDPKNSFTRYMQAYLKTFGLGMMTRDPQVEDDLRQAIAISPQFPPPYGLLAVYMAAHNEDLPGALAFAQKAVSLEPANSAYQLALAQVLLRMDKYDDAQLAASRARAWARDPQEKANAASFQAQLQQARQFHAAEAEENTSDDPASANSPGAPLEKAEGVVTDESCEHGLRIDVQSATGLLHLRRAGGAVTSIDGPTTPGFNECTSLKGLHVEVEYRPAAEKSDTGTMRSLHIFVPDHSRDLAPGMAIAEGKVTAITCTGNNMKLTMAVADKPLLLHAADYTKVAYLAGANSSLGDLDPCSDLKGRQVKVTFAVAQQKQLAGEIQAIVVGK